jgi:hypothetical protein
VINNHKYKSINLLRNIEADSTIKEKKSNILEEEKNSYLFQKKIGICFNKRKK